MKIKVNEGHAGVMTLKDGTTMNYGVIFNCPLNLCFYTL